MMESRFLKNIANNDRGLNMLGNVWEDVIDFVAIQRNSGDIRITPAFADNSFDALQKQ